jgi:hypothetical protein
MTIVRFPIVAFAYVVDRLRHVPGGRLIERHVALVVTAAMLAAGLTFVAWGAEKSPQRIDLPSLANGQLSFMQSWIIISGQLGNESITGNEYRYLLTDPAVPKAELIVVSSIQRPLGQTTLSGTYVGTREPLAGDFKWIGQMRADVELAKEQDPPWITIGITIVALLLAWGSRTSYPTFFHKTPRAQTVRHASLLVGVRRGLRGEAGPASPGSLVISPGAPVELREPGTSPLSLRLHSAHTSLEAVELRRLSSAEPALLVHLPTAELTLSFASNEDRDMAHAALTADVTRG